MDKFIKYNSIAELHKQLTNSVQKICVQKIQVIFIIAIAKSCKMKISKKSVIYVD